MSSSSSSSSGSDSPSPPPKSQIRAVNKASDSPDFVHRKPDDQEENRLRQKLLKKRYGGDEPPPPLKVTTKAAGSGSVPAKREVVVVEDTEEHLDIRPPVLAQPKRGSSYQDGKRSRQHDRVRGPTPLKHSRRAHRSDRGTHQRGDSRHERGTGGQRRSRSPVHGHGDRGGSSEWAQKHKRTMPSHASSSPPAAYATSKSTHRTSGSKTKRHRRDSTGKDRDRDRDRTDRDHGKRSHKRRQMDKERSAEPKDTGTGTGVSKDRIITVEPAVTVVVPASKLLEKPVSPVLSELGTPSPDAAPPDAPAVDGIPSVTSPAVSKESGEASDTNSEEPKSRDKASKHSSKTKGPQKSKFESSSDSEPDTKEQDSILDALADDKPETHSDDAQPISDEEHHQHVDSDNEEDIHMRHARLRQAELKRRILLQQTKLNANKALSSEGATSPMMGENRLDLDNSGDLDEPMQEEEDGSDEEPEDDLSHLPVYYPGVSGCRSVEEFHCLNRIEEGTYGVVYRAQEKRTDDVVALKRLKMEKEKDGFPITSLREINMLLKAGKHENVVTVREIVVGSNMDKIYLVMDYVEHDMKGLMESMKHPFLVGEVKTLMQQLLAGVHHMHDNWILHRDLKTSNLLLSHTGVLKIGDFGLAREYGSPIKPYTPVVVTLWYRAPELLLGTKVYSTPIDMWSVGCIMAEFLTLKPLVPGRAEVDQINKIFQKLGTPNPDIWPEYPDLPAVKKMTFAQQPYNHMRKHFGAGLSEHGLALINKFLTYNPSSRVSALDGLQHDWFSEDPQPVRREMFPTWPAKSEQNKQQPAHRQEAHKVARTTPQANTQANDQDSQSVDQQMLDQLNVNKREISGGFALRFDVPKF